MTRSCVKDLFQSLKLNPLFLMNMLGRPDYWAPQTFWDLSSEGDFQSCGELAGILEDLHILVLKRCSRFLLSTSTLEPRYTRRAPFRVYASRRHL
jgi:hypothetical protein